MFLNEFAQYPIGHFVPNFSNICYIDETYKNKYFTRVMSIRLIQRM